MNALYLRQTGVATTAGVGNGRWRLFIGSCWVRVAEASGVALSKRPGIRFYGALELIFIGAN
jgi:hypothetical protein